MENCPRRLRNECDRNPKDCGLIRHHIYYPRSQYEKAGEVPAQFRELGFFIVQMCKKQEVELHNAQPQGPPIPTIEFMERMIEVDRLRRDLSP